MCLEQILVVSQNFKNYRHRYTFYKGADLFSCSDFEIIFTCIPWVVYQPEISFRCSPLLAIWTGFSLYCLPDSVTAQVVGWLRLPFWKPLFSPLFLPFRSLNVSWLRFQPFPDSFLLLPLLCKTKWKIIRTHTIKVRFKYTYQLLDFLGMPSLVLVLPFPFQPFQPLLWSQPVDAPRRFRHIQWGWTAAHWLQHYLQENKH